MKTKQIIWKSFVLVIFFTVVCGIIYPLTMTAISQVLFPAQANGSLIYEENTVIGSELLSQPIQDTAYFVGRPDDQGVSNLGSESDALKKLVQERTDWWHDFDPTTKDKVIPEDLLYASGSGRDPHISLEAALFQVDRIAKERNVDAKVIKQLINENKTEEVLGFFGNPYVNVLELNLLLDNLDK